MAEFSKTLIIGGGQAGLSLSYYLSQQNQPHLVLDRAALPADAWRNHRWDSFTLVTPNWQVKLPGAEYQGGDPDGYLPRDAIVKVIEDYIRRYQLPVRFGVEATAIEQMPQGYRVKTSAGDYEAANVVLATGLFQTPKIPPFSAQVPPSILQLHSSQYRNPDQLPPGAVLVVGSAQSGCQITEDLFLSGRKVYLCTGSAGRFPRHYRGKDLMWWMVRTGFFDQPPDKLPSSKARFFGNPHVTGARGGHTINLHQFARDGIVLLGHIHDIQQGKVSLTPDLKENLAKADQMAAMFTKSVDDYIAAQGLADVPLETLPDLRDGYDAEEILELDLADAGINAIIWACGYKFDFSWISFLHCDGDGYPLQQRGVTAHQGLYILGLPWLTARKSGLFLGVGEDAAYLASQIAARSA